MKFLRAVCLHAKPQRALAEGALSMLLFLLLAFWVLADLPATNVPTTLLFLTQFPLGWAALRLRLATHLDWKTLRAEAWYGLILRLVSLGIAGGLAAIFNAATLLTAGRWSLPLGLALLLFTLTWLPWMLYRLFFYAARAWLNFTRRSLLWTLVNSYLVAVILVVAAATIFTWTNNYSQKGTTFWPDDRLSAAVLELVRGILPWFAVSVVYLLAMLIVFLPPALLLAYLTARHFVSRIQGLAQAMHRARGGDLSVRVVPSGADEVAQLQKDFNQMSADLQAEREKVNTLLSNQRELAAVVSHELRTPLTVLRAVLETDLNAQQQGKEIDTQDLNTLLQETLHLQALVEDLFTLSQLDSRRLELNCGWHDPAAIVRECQVALQPVAWRNKRIDLSVDLPEDLPQVWTDPRRLTQVLTNLIQNAVRHTPAGGAIVVQGAELEDGQVRLSVSDTGGGIRPEDMPHIWERYYRGGERRNQAGRMGIGLALVRELVEAMDGTTGAENLPGTGSRFWLALRSRRAD
jgi:signal transduction histidine kinase